MLTTSRKTCTIELPSGPTDFRITIIKPYLQESEESNTPVESITPIESHKEPPESPQSDTEKQDQDTQSEDITLRRNPPRSRQRPTRFQNMADITVYISKSLPSPANFQASRLKKLNELLEKGVFKIINTEDLPARARVFGSRFVDQVKNESTEKAFEKSRLVMQAFNDSEKHGILTQAPTIQRASQRLIIALSLAILQLSLYLRDIT